MGYHTISLDSIAPHPAHDCDRRTLSAAVDLEHVGLSVYTAQPGQQLPQHYHLHETQEELFYVLEGEIHVETPEELFVVGENQVFVVEPGHYHRTFNPADADGALRVLAVGGPNVSDGRLHESEPAASDDR